MFHDTAQKGVSRIPNQGWAYQKADNPLAVNGCALWLKSDLNFCTIPDTSTNAVSQWDDLSGYKNHALQATTANQPVWTRNVFHDFPAIAFTGSSSQFFKSTFIDSMTTSGATIYIVGQYHGTTGTFLDMSNGNTSANGLEVIVGGATHIDFAKAGFTAAASGTSAADTNYIIEAVSSQDRAIIGLNGTQGTQQTATNKVDYPCDTYAIGSLSTAGTYLTGYIFEIIVYRGAKTAFERKLIREYLSSKYVITST